VPDEAVGKMVRCPACQSSFLIVQPTQVAGSASSVNVPPLPATEPPAWDKDSLSIRCRREDETATSKRKKNRREDEDDEEEDFERKRQEDNENPFSLGGDDGSNRHFRPHSGGTILAMGILSLVLGCFPLAFITISMANVDLIQMAARRMDPSGKTLTQIGKVLAMVHVALLVLSLGVACCGIAFSQWRFRF
jgi:hypothetical protein